MGDNGANTNICMKFCLIKKREGGKKRKGKKGGRQRKGDPRRKKNPNYYLYAKSKKLTLFS